MGLLKKAWERQMQTISEAKEKKAKEKEFRNKMLEDYERKKAEWAKQDEERKRRQEAFISSVNEAGTKEEKAETAKKLLREDEELRRDIARSAIRIQGINHYDLELTEAEEEMLGIFADIFSDLDLTVNKRARDYICLDIADHQALVRFHAGERSSWLSFIVAEEDEDELKDRTKSRPNESYWKFSINNPEDVRQYAPFLRNSVKVHQQFK